MTKEYSLESIIAVDCGSVWTKALLIDVVEGQYRLIARGQALSTIRPPHANAMLGVARAINQIEAHAGRRLLDSKTQLITPERPDGSGADAFVATASAARPLRVFLLGLAGDVSLASARRALAGCNAVVADSLSLEDRLDRPEGVENALARFDRAAADAVIIVGGTDGNSSDRALDLAGVLALAYQVADPSRRPPVIYAGNAALSQAAMQTFAGLCEVKVVDNVRPGMDVENLEPLRAELQTLYAESKLQRVPGLGSMISWSRTPLMPTMQAQNHVLRYLSAHYGLNVAGLEFAASGAAVSWAYKGNASFVTGEEGATAGLSIGERVGLPGILRWLPEASEPAEALGALHNLSLYHGVAPAGAAETTLVQAAAREAFAPVIARARQDWQSAAGDDPAWDLIILSGSTLVNASSPGQAALLALDVLQPVGVSGMVMDSTTLGPALGAIAALEPVAATQVLDQDGFLSLGTIVAPRGMARPGEVAMGVKVTYADGRTLQVEVKAGGLEVIPLALGQKATLQLRPGRNFDLGWTRRNRKATVEVDGGLLGIVVDARGRPVNMPEPLNAAQEKMRQWLWEIGA